MHILVLGQSNVANHGEGLARCDWGKCNNNGRIVPLIDPIPGGSGQRGSVWTRFSPLLRKSGDEEELLISMYADGGTSISDWSHGGKCYNNLIENGIPSLLKIDIPVSHIVYHQGERDNFLGTSCDDYVEAFDPLHLLLRTTFQDAPIIVCTASYRMGVTSDEVRRAQQRIQTTKDNCYAGVDTDLFGEEFRFDNTHFNSKGLDAFAHAFFDIVQNIPTGKIEYDGVV